MNLIAIDPGKSGGIAWLVGGTVNAVPMPKGDTGPVEQLREIVQLGECRVFMERVGGYIGKPQPGSRMFNFGRSVGVLVGALVWGRVSIAPEVLPQVWQKRFSLGSAGDCESKSAWKRKLQEHAQKMYPHLKVTLKTADALLILDYARSQQQPTTT